MYRQLKLVLQAALLLLIFCGNAFGATYDSTGTWKVHFLDDNEVITATLDQQGDSFKLSFQGTTFYGGTVSGATYSIYGSLYEEGDRTDIHLNFTLSSCAYGSGTNNWIWTNGYHTSRGIENITATRQGACVTPPEPEPQPEPQPQPEPVIPAVPDLKVTSSGMTFTMAWAPVAGANGYRLYYVPCEGSDAVESLDLGTQTRLSFDLWLGACYHTALNAYNAAGQSELSRGYRLSMRNSDTPPLDESQAPGRILFTSSRDGDYELYVVDEDGSNLVKLTENTVMDSMGRWSADGTKIAFIRKSSEVWVMDSDGSNPYRVGSGNTVDFSPDDARLVFSSNTGASYGEYHLFSHDLSSGITTRITNLTGASKSPDWSRGGGRIAFTNKYDRYGELYRNIYTLNAETSEMVRLTDYDDSDAAYPTSPRWSPDGSEILYHMDYFGGGEYYVALMDKDGGNIRRIGDGLSACWSPDGGSIAYSKRDGRYFQIYVTTPSGESHRPLFPETPSAHEFPLDWRGGGGQEE